MNIKRAQRAAGQETSGCRDQKKLNAEEVNELSSEGCTVLDMWVVEAGEVAFLERGNV